MSDPSLRYDVPGHRLICCLCMEWVEFSDLYVDPAGGTWDYCVPCAEDEAIAAVFLFMAGRPLIDLFASIR